MRSTTSLAAVLLVDTEPGTVTTARAALRSGEVPAVRHRGDPGHLPYRLLHLAHRGDVGGGEWPRPPRGDDGRGLARVRGLKRRRQPAGLHARARRGEELGVVGVRDRRQAGQQARAGNHADQPHGDDQPAVLDVESRDGREHLPLLQAGV